MNQNLLLRKIAALHCFLFYCSVSSASGAWFKTPTQLAQFPREFAILKTGIFSRNGKLSIVATQTDLETACAQTKDLHAWVTHRLSPQETLDKSAAERLGKALNDQLAPTCVRAVEIDVEPLPDLPDWFRVFAKELRVHLKDQFRLRPAIPAVSARAAGKTTWPEASAEALLKEIDGLDFMIYDTAAGTMAEYGDILLDTLAFAARMPTEKNLIFGLPAYPDNTKRHRPGVESLANVRKTVEANPKAAAALCPANRRISYYAGWTLTPAEKTDAQKLEAWVTAKCGR